MDTRAVNKEMALISNVLAAYTFIADHLERAALFFMCGVCLGLFFTLLALVVQISCRKECRTGPKRQPRSHPRVAKEDSEGSNSDSDSDSASDLSARRHRRSSARYAQMSSCQQRSWNAQRLEERERIIREIWMNGQPDVPGTLGISHYY